MDAISSPVDESKTLRLRSNTHDFGVRANRLAAQQRFERNHRFLLRLSTARGLKLDLNMSTITLGIAAQFQPD
jgi:hypothetical protein